MAHKNGLVIVTKPLLGFTTCGLPYVAMFLINITTIAQGQNHVNRVSGWFAPLSLRAIRLGRRRGNLRGPILGLSRPLPLVYLPCGQQGPLPETAPTAPRNCLGGHGTRECRGAGPLCRWSGDAPSFTQVPKIRVQGIHGAP